MIHHRSWFPFVVVGLSLSLALVVGWMFASRVASPMNLGGANEAESVKPVSDVEYQSQASMITRKLVPVLDQADATQKITNIDLAMSGLLALLVPAERRELHQELVFSLNKMRVGLANSDDGLYEEGRVRFDELLVQYPWLR